MRMSLRSLAITPTSLFRVLNDTNIAAGALHMLAGYLERYKV